jgi:pectin methylesterase-like acyl-CoA thioesterase
VSLLLSSVLTSKVNLLRGYLETRVSLSVNLPNCVYHFLLLLTTSSPSRCVVTGNGEAAYMYLGRPWEPFGRVVFADTFMDHCIEPVGWHNWDKPENEQTACFYEYRSQPCPSVSHCS